jgi:hypothetical protein
LRSFDESEPPHATSEVVRARSAEKRARMDSLRSRNADDACADPHRLIRGRTTTIPR